MKKLLVLSAFVIAVMLLFTIIYCGIFYSGANAGTIDDAVTEITTEDKAKVISIVKGLLRERTQVNKQLNDIDLKLQQIDAAGTNYGEIINAFAVEESHKEKEETTVFGYYER